MLRVLSFIAGLAGLLFCAGCTTVKTTTTARTATEQLLLSTATDHALHDLNLDIFAGRRVYLDTTYFDSYDSKYVLGTVRDALSRAGALLADNKTNSDVVIEARSGALALNQEDFMFGIPAVTLPIPLSGPVQTPEIAFYSAKKQLSLAKFALLAYDRQSLGHIYSSGSLDGHSYDRRYHLIFVSWCRTDVPEDETSTEKKEKFQTWFPQYDLTNLPAAGK